MSTAFANVAGVIDAPLRGAGIYNSVATLKPGDPLVVTVFPEGKVLRLTTMIER